MNSSPKLGYPLVATKYKTSAEPTETAESVVNVSTILLGYRATAQQPGLLKFSLTGARKPHPAVVGVGLFCTSLEPGARASER